MATKPTKSTKAKATAAKTKTKAVVAKKKPVIAKKTSRSTKTTPSTTMSNTDWLVLIWVAMIAIFLAVVIKVYVIG